MLIKGLGLLPLVMFAICALSFTKVNASPWIGTTDPQLHYDLQILVDHGYLQASATTFPVPWKGITNQLDDLNLAEMSSIAVTSARRLKHYSILLQRKPSRSSVTLYGGTDRSRFASFDGQQGEKWRINTTTETRYKRLAAKISVNYETRGETNFDQSYLAYQFGEFNLRLGSIDQWWGPAHSNSLVFSNNARPIPTLALSRSSAIQSESPWLSFLGPWYFTAQVGQLEDSRSVPDAKIWATRFTSRPFSGLEVGLSWVATWGGDGQPDRFSDFFKVITFRERCLDGTSDCLPESETRIGNHLGGIDLKYTTSVFEHPLSIYTQIIDEGESAEFNASNHANTFGLSTYIKDAKVYLEYSDTNVACSESGSDITNCFYESGTYSSGYRYYRRQLTESVNSEANMWSLGYLRHFSDGDVIELAVRHINLDTSNNIDTSESFIATEKIYQLSGYYQTVWRHWQLKLGGVLDSSDTKEQGIDHDVMIFAELKYSL